MKKITNLLLSILLILPCFFLSACDSNVPTESGYAGKWSGNTIIPKEQTIYCEDYETLDGQYLGRRKSTSSHKMFLVDNVSKDLVLTYDGLVDRLTSLYLGTTYTTEFVLKDKTNGDLLYTSEDVTYYSYRACFDKDTNVFLGLYTNIYELGNYKYSYTINGQSYTSDEIDQYDNAYVDNSSNKYVGVDSDFNRITTYIVADVEYTQDEVFVLNGMYSSTVHEDWFGGNSGYAYVENGTKMCYKKSQVVETYGHYYGENDIEVPSDQVKQITRKCLGNETTTINANFGDYYAEIEVKVDLKYNYDEIKDYTFTSADKLQVYSYKGHFGVLDGTIYFTAEMYHNGYRWVHYEEINRKFMFEIKGNKLLFTDDSPEFTEYKDVTLTK